MFWLGSENTLDYFVLQFRNQTLVPALRAGMQLILFTMFSNESNFFASLEYLLLGFTQTLLKQLILRAKVCITVCKSFKCLSRELSCLIPNWVMALNDRPTLRCNRRCWFCTRKFLEHFFIILHFLHVSNILKGCDEADWLNDWLID